MKRYRYYYYLVEIPKDIQDPAWLAMDEAERRTKLYMCPAEWSAWKVGENALNLIFKVCRKVPKKFKNLFDTA